MNRIQATVLLVLIVVMGGACTADVSDLSREGRTTLSLSVPGLVPVPWDDELNQSAWDGSSVDLQLADAWAGCSFANENTAIDASWFKDGYLNAVLMKMTGLLPSAQPSCVDLPDGVTRPWSDMGYLERWYYLRTSRLCNRDPSTNLSQAAALTKNIVEYRITLELPLSYRWRRPRPSAEQDLRLPAINHCIAVRLRQAAPGAMGAESLLLPSSEQRILLAEQKNRSQLAVLGYAQLLTVFAAPEAASGAQLTPDQRIPLLQWWARQPGNAAALQRMQEDFAAAVQLHITTSRELAEMLARSASARLPRGGVAANRAEEEWGPGSFRARAMASLYGGDPLVEEPAGTPPTPWAHPFGKNAPGFANLPNISGYPNQPWPDRLRSPFVTTELGGPKPSFFLGLAREADALLLSLSPDDKTLCWNVVREASARRMMRAVEADLRTKTCSECLSSGPGPDPVCLECKLFSTEDVADAELDDIESLVIWQRHRIGLDDAEKTVALLSDFLSPVCNDDAGESDIRPGARQVSGALSMEYPDGVGSLPWLRVSKDASFRDPSWKERITPYLALAPWRMPNWFYVFPLAPASHQGFPPITSTSHVSPPEEAKRVMGSMSALAAVREAIVSVDLRLASSPHPNLGDHLVMGERIARLAASAAGQRSASVRPTLALSGGDVSVGTAANGDPRWEVSIIVPSRDAFWDMSQHAYSLGVVRNHRLAQRLASNPDAVLWDETQTDLETQAVWFPFVVPSSWPVAAPTTRRFVAYVSLPGTDLASWTLVVRKSVPERVYALLAGSMRIWTREPSHGQYIGGGGQLGIFSRRFMTARSDEPAKPAFDGFGMPTTWVPPTDPALFGDGKDAVPHYLERARFAADEATEAVSGAMEALMAQQQDEAEAASARAWAGKIADLEMERLCGEGNVSCDVSLVDWNPDIDVPTLDCAGNLSANETLECHAKDMLEPIGDLPLAGVVAAEIANPAPMFDDFNGGALQGVLIQQWRAAKGVVALAAELNQAVSEAKDTMDRVAAELAHYDELVRLNCGPEAMANAQRAGGATSSGTSETETPRQCSAGYIVGISFDCNDAMDAVGGFLGGFNPFDFFPPVKSGSTSQGESYSDAPLIAQQLKCDEVAAQYPALLSGVILEQNAAMGRVSAFSRQISDAIGGVQWTNAELFRLLHETNLTRQQAEMEAELLAATRPTTFGLYRTYHSYDMWRAKALLESARRYAVAARRAIEARYVVDLSSLDADEAFVAAPSSWADEVYTYDLSLPAAVGLAVTTENEAGGIYPNKVSDYVSNLEHFVEGFAIARPTASSYEDREVFALPGLEWTPCQLVDDGGCEGGGPVDAASVAWSFYCPDAETWVPLPETGNAEDACEVGRPTQARIRFSLDPWGRKGLDIAHEPFAQRYNARWTRMAVNLVGTGIKDCSNATDPATCYSQPFIRYNLSHIGSAWVTDHEGRWKALGFDEGRIEGAKALATESWLDPVSDSWADTQIAAVMRGELLDRPLGGTYELVMEVPPELDLSHLEMIQIMLGNAYWVKQ